MRSLLAVLLAAGAAANEPLPKASDYPAHAELPGLSLGAEYLARSFSLHGKSFLTEDHLVVEVGVYPTPRRMIEVKHAQFRLRLNGKETLPARGPSFVAASIKYSDWEQRPGIEASAGPIVLGRRTPEPRFPGDTRPSQGRLPAPPRAPGGESGLESDEEPLTADRAAVAGALVEGPREKPGRGYVYFHFPGKTKKLKSVELLYDGPAGTAVLKLL